MADKAAKLRVPVCVAGDFDWETWEWRVFHQLADAMRIAEFDPAALVKCLTLVVLPFASEDLAFILGGYIVVNHLAPVGLVVLCIYGGMVASDFVLYGIGAGARRIPWLSRIAIDDGIKTFTDTFQRNMFAVVALCRLVPGVFVALIACGWTRVPFARFTVASLLVSALYLPLMLYLVVASGDALDDHVGQWTWPFLLAVVVFAGFVRNRVFGFEAGEPAAVTTEAPAPILRRASAISRSASRPPTY
jgi:membrane protein DedA with SNARE-associated domain